MSYFNQTIPLASLTKPSGPRAPQYKWGDEAKFYDAYVARLDVARALGTSRKYFDGVHYLNITSECLLKYLFCLVRHEIYQTQPQKDLDEKSPFDYASGFLIPRNKLDAKGFFNHDLHAIVRFLTRFSDANNYSEFNKYILNVQSVGDWIANRYDSVAQISYQQRYLDYLRDMDALLNGCLARVK